MLIIVLLMCIRQVNFDVLTHLYDACACMHVCVCVNVLKQVFA